MLSQFRVAKLASAEEHDRLLNEVLMNTRPLPLNVRLRLSQSDALAASALGLALRRLTELTYRPEPPAESLILRLLDFQVPPDGQGGAGTGAFGSQHGSIPATAIAIGALRAVQQQIAMLPGTRAGMRFLAEGLDERIEAAIAAALYWLGQQPRASTTHGTHQSAFDRRFAEEEIGDDSASDNEHDVERRGVERFGTSERADAPALLGDPIDTGITLWQLGADARAAEALDLESLARAADAAGLAHHRDTAPLLECIEREQPEMMPARRAA